MLSTRRVRFLGVTLFSWLCVACTVSPQKLQPATFEKAPTAATGVAGAPQDARVALFVKRSPDDSGGLELVAKYVPLRQKDGGAWEPFAFEQKSTDVELVFFDLTAAPGATYRYQVFALAEREVASFGTPGALTQGSEVSAAIVVRNPGAVLEGRDVRSPSEVSVHAPDDDSGAHLLVTFRPSPDDTGPEGAVLAYQMLRSRTRSGPFEPFADSKFEPGTGVGGVRSERVIVPDAGPWYFQVWAVSRTGAAQVATSASPGTPVADYYNAGRTNVAILLILAIVLSFGFLRLAEKGVPMFIRRIAGVDAIEEAIGRATEMGRPILYVPGIDEIQNIQTIAAVLVLGRIAELAARYDSEIKVPCCIPLVAAVGEEVVRQGFYDAGRPDAHKPQNIQWISSEQFAFCAGTNGIMMRDKPATNIFLGRFFGESLILAETGYVNGAIQIAGTAEITQLPFFIAACDYTLIGEEIYAVSAYMTRDPKLLSTIKAADWVKALCVAVVIVGTLLAVAAPESKLTTALMDFLAVSE